MRTALVLSLLLLLAACQTQIITSDPAKAVILPAQIRNPAQPMDLVPHFGEITIKTVDGLNISGTLYGNESRDGIVMVHQMGKDRESWKPIIHKLKNKYKILTIDLRGHGKSQGDITKFTDGDYQKFPNDVQAAAFYLKRIGVKNIAIVGASIGANAALQYAVKDENVSTLVLLSPGIQYHGIDSIKPATRYSNAMLLVSGNADKYSTSTVNTLRYAHPNAKLVTYSTSAHGTEIFGRNVGLEDEIYSW